MDEAEQQRVAFLREQAQRSVAEENERLARSATIDCCDACPEPKEEYDRETMLPNGIRLSTHCRRCAAPSPECTAVAQANLPSETAEVANRIVQWLGEQPELEVLGVTWMTCLHWTAERYILTFRVPAWDRVAAAVRAVPLAEFQRQAEPGAAPDRRIIEDFLEFRTLRCPAGG